MLTPMRSFVLTIVVVALLAPGLAVAANANANANANNGNGKGGTAAANGVGNAGGLGLGNGGGKGAAVAAPEHGGGPAAGSVVPPAPATTDQDLALKAVRSGQAMPLSDVVKQAVARWGGRVIDARLVDTGSRLVYRLTLISDTGLSQRIFVDAKTAVPVKVN